MIASLRIGFAPKRSSFYSSPKCCLIGHPLGLILRKYRGTQSGVRICNLLLLFSFSFCAFLRFVFLHLLGDVSCCVLFVCFFQ